MSFFHTLSFSSLSRLKSKSVALLLVRGASKDLPDREGLAPIHLAVKAFDEEEKRSLASVRSLLDFGANINSVDENGYTALHWAFYSHKTETAGSHILVVTRVAEVGVLAETAKYPSMLARSARLQIFATKNTVFYNCKFLQHKHRFFALALTALR